MISVCQSDQCIGWDRVDDVYTYESTSLPNVPTLHIMYGAQYVHSSRAAMIEKSWVCTADRAASYCDQAELRS